MFLRRTERKKNGKTHSYWNIVETKRLDDGRGVIAQDLGQRVAAEILAAQGAVAERTEEPPGGLVQ